MLCSRRQCLAPRANCERLLALELPVSVLLPGLHGKGSASLSPPPHPLPTRRPPTQSHTPLPLPSPGLARVPASARVEDQASFSPSHSRVSSPVLSSLGTPAIVDIHPAALAGGKEPPSIRVLELSGAEPSSIPGSIPAPTQFDSPRSPCSTTTADRVKRFFGIEPDQIVNDPTLYDDGSYIEEDPSVMEALFELFPTIPGILNYLKELFPFLGWIFHYNLTWLLGDFIAGVTVGFVVVPQGMAYALLANLPAEYGLYTSFVGFILYWAFATSKDITIGAVAVMSTIVGNIVINVQKEHPELAADVIARSLALISGVVLLFLGLVRLGRIVEFISLVAIGAFMTGSAISIAAGQVPNLLGISGVNTREATYLVIINTLKGLPRAKLDAAMGMTALFGLYFIRWFCSYMGKKYPKRQKTWFFISTLRMAFIVILYILVSWLANRHVKKASEAKFKILGTVPSGFQHVGAPRIDTEILSALGPDIPTTILVLLIEHIAISKSFGRVNNYIINPSQELVAIGFTNVFGPFLGGYPATGSFSRTAIKAKAGVRTPLAGIFTAIIVLLALYALTSVFFYIPSAGLSALIIHAVGDLITPPREVYKYWQTSPLEFVIFFAGVFVSIFTSIENGIYTTVAASGALLLFRLVNSPGKFLGKVSVKAVPRSTLRGNGSSSQDSLLDEKSHSAFAALDRSDLSNPEVDIKSPYPGVFIYRFGEGLNYVNSARHLDTLTIYIFNRTRRTQLNKYDKIGDRPWNDPGPRRGKVANSDEIAARPILRSIILDFTAVNFLDVTATQALIDLRNQFDRYADPERVEWHFAGVSNRWTRRALVASGFGTERRDNAEDDKGLFDPLLGAGSGDGKGPEIKAKSKDDIEAAAGEITPVASSRAAGGRLAPVYGINRPYFHVDVETAVASTIQNLERRGSDYSGRE
ncbi:sulfate transporter family-domain-containing protein [Staphylotrichum tortipilum]|uniref:Sulfate transporter family-domain-containing protein n=1 Tax=Staphylotrichum tortipilum TaxID=2831512 RepID=A0AAN6MK55_9PEZI|nr:sulfate transporter family-domain-containing protein [Staphylotrichum longicolle]